MKVVAALVPFLGMFVVFVVVLRAIVFGDRREREALKRLEQENPAHLPDPSRSAIPPTTTSGSSAR